MSNVLLTKQVVSEDEKLDPDFKTKWLDALRSGEYSQAGGFLRTDFGFCCLGVACDVLNADGWWRNSGAFGRIYDWANAEGGVHDNEVSGGLPFIDNKIAGYLANTNDRGASFEEIADWIEENL
jgi:hypothetical protein